MSPSGRASQIVDAVRSYSRAHALFRPGPLVVAVSGGTDSTALCLIVAQLQAEFGLVPHVAHFDHRVRPRAAAGDAAFVGELANRIGAPLRVGRADAAPKNEDEARRARYEFLRRVARELGATAIATGHTRDDQAETVLLHIARGSGIAGLAGMRPSRDGIVRPLLAIGRSETAAVCRAARIRPREDPSNRSLRFARNRIRHRVLPELAKLNPEIAAALARLADAAAAAADEEIGEAATAVAASSTVPDALDLARLPVDPAARGDALALWWERLTGQRLAARPRAALERLAASTAGTSAIDLPGGRALREYAVLRLGRPDAVASDGPVELRPGETRWHGWRFVVDGDDERGSDFVAHLDADRVVVRTRRPGDRLRGPNAAKVQDVLTNAKVPARLRDRWPIVTADDAVVWVPGATPPPRSGRIAIGVTRPPSDTEEMTRGHGEQVASLREAGPGRARKRASNEPR